MTDDHQPQLLATLAVAVGPRGRPGDVGVRPGDSPRPRMTRSTPCSRSCPIPRTARTRRRQADSVEEGRPPPRRRTRPRTRSRRGKPEADAASGAVRREGRQAAGKRSPTTRHRSRARIRRSTSCCRSSARRPRRRRRTIDRAAVAAAAEKTDAGGPSKQAGSDRSLAPLRQGQGDRRAPRGAHGPQADEEGRRRRAERAGRRDHQGDAGHRAEALQARHRRDDPRGAEEGRQADRDPDRGGEAVGPVVDAAGWSCAGSGSRASSRRPAAGVRPKVRWPRVRAAPKPASPTTKHSNAGGKDIWGHLPPEMRRRSRT